MYCPRSSWLDVRKPRTARDSRQIVLGSIDEEAFLAHVLVLARQAGCCVIHCRYSQGVLQGAHTLRNSDHDDASGWPDLILAGPTEDVGILFRELKREKGRVDPNQRRWGERLRAAGGNWDVWRPSDEDRICAEIGLRVVGRRGLA